jgi:hypothetical protein
MIQIPLPILSATTAQAEGAVKTAGSFILDEENLQDAILRGKILAGKSG